MIEENKQELKCPCCGSANTFFRNGYRSCREESCGFIAYYPEWAKVHKAMRKKNTRADSKTVSRRFWCKNCGDINGANTTNDERCAICGQPAIIKADSKTEVMADCKSGSDVCRLNESDGFPCYRHLMESFERIEAESDRLKSELRTERDHTIDAGCRITEIEAEVERLKADLSKFQMSEFHPDWSLLKASIDNNGECDIEIKRLTKGCQELESEVERLKDEHVIELEQVQGAAITIASAVCKERDDLKRKLEASESRNDRGLVERVRLMEERGEYKRLLSVAGDKNNKYERFLTTSNELLQTVADGNATLKTIYSIEKFIRMIQ